MNYLVYFSVFITALLSGISVLYLRISKQSLKLILSFSGAYLFGISVLHLIPEIYSAGDNRVGLYILAGFILQVLMEFFSEGIEHGHIHVHDHAEKAFPSTMMIALSIHSFLEGMPLAPNYVPVQGVTRDTLLAGIIMHNIPIAIALMSMLLQAHLSRRNAILWLVVFALMTPLGTFTAYAVGENMILDLSKYFDKIMAIVIGIFLHISTTILFESTENHRFNFIKFMVILLGAGAAMIAI